MRGGCFSAVSHYSGWTSGPGVIKRGCTFVVAAS